MTVQFAAPTSLEALAPLLAQEAIWLVAGGTDRLISPAHLPQSGLVVDLSRIAGVRDIAVIDDVLHLGAGVTVADLARHPLVARHAPVLVQVAAVFGSVQIRNRATLGGNVAHGSAAADLLPALMAAGAAVQLWHPEATERVPLAALLARTPRLQPNEVIWRFELPLANGTPLGRFVKLGPRREPVISRLTLAAAGPAGRLQLFAGAIGPVPLRLAEAETLLNSGAPGFAEAVAGAVGAANPGRASTAYKARAVLGLAADFLEGLQP